jgi:cardiolipin synthase
MSASGAPGLRRLFHPVAVLVPGNRLRLLQNGEQYFPALIAAIDAARIEVRLETYIFNLDASGTRVADALLRAVARGVRVALLVDGVGSRPLPRRWLDGLTAAGIRVLLYRKPYFGWLADPLNLRRQHRKLALIDARIAFVGGINIIDDFVPPGSVAPRLDYAVEIEGPLIADIYRDCRRVWQLVARTQLRAAMDDLPALAPAWPSDGHARAAYVVRDNLRNRRNIERAYLTAIGSARDELIIACAYFLPGRGFRRALKKAARRGVRIHLLTQGRSDHAFFHAASSALYEDLLGVGMRISEYHASELHAKVAVADGRWLTIGSSNIDPFSLLLAREANIVSTDAPLAQQLRERLHHAIEHGASEVLPADWRRRSWMRRAQSWFAYGVVRWVVGLVGYTRWV